MKRIITIFLILLTGFFSAHILISYAGALDGIGPSALEKISAASINITPGDGTANGAKNFGLGILGVIRVAISGFALIYLVMIGAYMVLASDNEENVKKQRKQMIYAIVGFLFLNIPNLVYTIFSPENASNTQVGTIDNFSETNSTSVFWNTSGFEGIMGNMVAFLRVFVFGVAVTMFTWGLFNLLISGGDDEKKKKAKNRIVYGILGLIFMGFVGLWGELVAVGNFADVKSESGKIFSLVMYFVAPIAIFMLIWGAYYFITSAGDEERMKKGKSILINTGIAIIILLSALSFITDLTKFQL